MSAVIRHAMHGCVFRCMRPPIQGLLRRDGAARSRSLSAAPDSRAHEHHMVRTSRGVDVHVDEEDAAAVGVSDRSMGDDDLGPGSEALALGDWAARQQLHPGLYLVPTPIGNLQVQMTAAMPMCGCMHACGYAFLCACMSAHKPASSEHTCIYACAGVRTCRRALCHFVGQCKYSTSHCIGLAS